MEKKNPKKIKKKQKSLFSFFSSKKIDNLCFTFHFYLLFLAPSMENMSSFFFA